MQATCRGKLCPGQIAFDSHPFTPPLIVQPGAYVSLQRQAGNVSVGGLSAEPIAHQLEPTLAHAMFQSASTQLDVLVTRGIAHEADTPNLASECTQTCTDL